jgi:hypothetical protein
LFRHSVQCSILLHAIDRLVVRRTVHVTGSGLG